MGEICDGESNGRLWCLVGHGVPLVERKGGRDL